MKQTTKILILEDHELITWALTNVIRGNFPDFNLMSSRNLSDGLLLLKEHTVRLIILDIDLPGGNSTNMMGNIRSIQPDVPILIHTGLEEKTYALKYLTAGANGFLSKKASLDTVIEAIKSVIDGKKYISPITHSLISESFLTDPYGTRRRHEEIDLSQREKQVVRLMLKGAWTKEIANTLGLKQTTISTHKSRIYDKFDVSNPMELLKKVQKEMPELLTKDNDNN